MGYYSTLREVNIDKAKINPKQVDEFLKEVEEKCQFGFSKRNCEIGIDENGNITDFDFENYYCKWYDAEDMGDILKKYLVEGSVEFLFTGEDGEVWGEVVFPNVVLEYDLIDNWKKIEPNVLLDVLNKSNASEETKRKIIEEYKNYWEAKKEKAEKVLREIG